MEDANLNGSILEFPYSSGASWVIVMQKPENLMCYISWSTIGKQPCCYKRRFKGCGLCFTV